MTVDLDDSIQKALNLMLEHDFDQLPVVSDDGVEGTVTYKSVAECVKSIDDASRLPRKAEPQVDAVREREIEMIYYPEVTQ